MAEYFEELYVGTCCKWGLKPDFILVHFLELFPKGPVLDLGMGEGRNALFLAEKGFEVEGVDVSKTAIARAIRLAKERKLDINAHVSDLRDFKIAKQKYSLIIAAGASLNFLKKSEIEDVAERIKGGLKNGGFVFVSVISTNDSAYKRARKQLVPVEENTFYSSRIGAYIHYFTYKEVKKLFSDMQTIIHLKGLELDFHDTPHYHDIIYYLGKVEN
ncbi:MAG: class I SAM-dependent methyltransferase [Candidatus Bathyarchaeia archaeon]